MAGKKALFNGNTKLIIWIGSTVFLAGVFYAAVLNNTDKIKTVDTKLTVVDNTSRTRDEKHAADNKQKNEKQDDKIQNAEVERTAVMVKQEAIHSTVQRIEAEQKKTNDMIMKWLRDKHDG